ncbi:MAG: M23 family metallopeptidase, partial [Chloroflexi bacterium]|nr:M23 family metallopeptidase [Chloroflexota bacterium]
QGYGNRIIVNHGNGITTTYNHLSAFLVQVGQNVSKGQVIARMGSTGNSTGPHLHFEILRNGSYINPLGALN